MNDQDLDRIRGQALDRVARAERVFKRLVAAAFAVEVGFLVAYFVLMDFSDRLHWLILVAAGLVYLTVATSLLALGAYLHLAEQRLLRAIGISGAP